MAARAARLAARAAAVAAAVAVAVVTVVVFTAPAHADTTWSVVPANADGPDGRSVIDIELPGGQQVTEHIAVINRSTQHVDFAIDANDGYLTAKGYFDMRPSDATPVDGGSWITVPDKVTIAAGATAVVPVTVAIPQNATPGDHPAGVTASLDTISGQVRVQNRVGVRLNIRVNGTYAAKVAVSDIHTTYTWSWNPFTPGTLDVTYTLANTGNVRLAPDSRILTSTLAGQNNWDDTSAAKAREIMPGGKRTFTARITGTWPLGPIDTTIMAIPSPAGKPLPGVTAERIAIDTTLWAIPWPQLALLTLLLLTLLTIRITSTRRRKRIEKLLILNNRGTPSEPEHPGPRTGRIRSPTRRPLRRPDRGPHPTPITDIRPSGGGDHQPTQAADAGQASDLGPRARPHGRVRARRARRRRCGVRNDPAGLDRADGRPDPRRVCPPGQDTDQDFDGAGPHHAGPARSRARRTGPGHARRRHRGPAVVTASDVETWRKAATAAVEGFADPPSGETATNVARSSLASAVRQIATTVDTYAAARDLTGVARTTAMGLAVRQRTDAFFTWSVGATALDAVNVDAGYGHQHVFLPTSSGEGSSPPTPNPRGVTTREQDIEIRPHRPNGRDRADARRAGGLRPQRADQAGGHGGRRRQRQRAGHVQEGRPSRH
ncbi:hypothetical protein GCM10027612_41900 [Microbispora bryophytorum subsp. camponoti]